MKKFYEIREHTMEIINFKKKKKKKNLLTNKKQKHMKTQKFVIFVKRNLKISMPKKKIIVKLGPIVIIQGNIEVLHIAYAI